MKNMSVGSLAGVLGGGVNAHHVAGLHFVILHGDHGGIARGRFGVLVLQQRHHLFRAPFTE
jgi:hypothetical protein